MSAYAISRYEMPRPDPRRRLLFLFLAAILHAGVFLLALLLVRPEVLPPTGSAVPVNIVTSDLVTDSRPAEEAPETQEAAVEAPEAEAPPTPPPPPAAVTPPAPPAPSPKPVPPKPTPTPTPQKAAVQPTPSAPSQPFSLDALERSIAKAAKSPPRPSSAPRGPTRAETAPQARPNAGQGIAMSDMQGLKQLLGRLWAPCVVVGGADVKLKATYSVGGDGRVVGSIEMGGAERSSDPTVFAAARRALAAIRQVEPYAMPFRDQRITVNFDARSICDA